jgi:hypothetical protein
MWLRLPFEAIFMKTFFDTLYGYLQAQAELTKLDIQDQAEQFGRKLFLGSVLLLGLFGCVLLLSLGLAQALNVGQESTWLGFVEVGLLWGLGLWGFWQKIKKDLLP